MVAVRSTAEASQGHTRILPVDVSRLGRFTFGDNLQSQLDDWDLDLEDSPDTSHLREAAENLRRTDIPVAFPTETVYGLGADATRSSAVQGIYKAKQRPSDNPLIVHICSLNQLRDLLEPLKPQSNGESHRDETSSNQQENGIDPIPNVYKPLIERFWPGPLTILLPIPPNSNLAPEVTAGLPTFGARMPKSLLALSLIKLAGVPIAAPSANASTKPSPTTAKHVLHDLEGRIDIILDGGPCDVGVESTVVDGLSIPPSILRPGGISIEQLRDCPGWESVTIGYEDGPSPGAKPRAPGMKYRHYSPKATVILYEADINHPPPPPDLDKFAERNKSLGVISTCTWAQALNLSSIESQPQVLHTRSPETTPTPEIPLHPDSPPFTLHSLSLPIMNQPSPGFTPHLQSLSHAPSEFGPQIWHIALGSNPETIARGLFAALRALDEKGVHVIFVEGIADQGGDVAAAIMNRLRKAAGKV